MQEKLICPQCHSSDISTTLIGIISGPDVNRVTCHNCEWLGTAGDWQLIKWMRSELTQRDEYINELLAELRDDLRRHVESLRGLERSLKSHDQG